MSLPSWRRLQSAQRRDQPMSRADRVTLMTEASRVRGGAIGLASQGGSLIAAGSIMVAFALGVSSIVLVLAYGAKSVLRSRMSAFQRIAKVSRPIMGVVFVAVGVAILLKFHHFLEFWALENLPEWFTALSVSI